MTVEELFENYKDYTALTEGHFEYLVDEEDFKKALIEFAKYHVQKALEASHSNFQLPEEEIEFTLNAYPLENIK